MKIHNLMEEIVPKHINSLYDNLKKEETWHGCDCENCRADTICYVLNRVRPRYVISARGFTHLSDIYNSQLKADLNAIGMEGVRAVASTIRPYHNGKLQKTQENDTKPKFNFPIIQGCVLNGSSFNPIHNAKVTLKLNEKIVEMNDDTWTNPAITHKSTKGEFSFWLKSLEAEKADETKTFSFILEVEAEGYSPLTYTFELHATSEIEDKSQFNSTYTIRLKDLVLFREGLTNPME